jgi:hypothetical protein
MTKTSLIAFALALMPLAAQAPLPELKTEATDGGSLFIVKNTGGQPLTGYLIELVNYPGSFYQLWADETTGAPLAPGAEKRIPVKNMTVGAAPEYVKLLVAAYADGTTAGPAERVAQMAERRKALLETTRELIRRLEKGTKPAVVGELKAWEESVPAPTRGNRAKQEGINSAAAKGQIAETASRVEGGTLEEALQRLRAQEKALAASLKL